MGFDEDRFWPPGTENGQIGRRKLARIVPIQFDPDLQGPALAHPEAAAAMSAFLAAAKAAGHGDLHVRYSYRTLPKQREKWAAWQAYKAYLAGGPWAPKANLAAEPGGSNHGWGGSFDLIWRLLATIAWAHAHAAEYGFVFDVAGEDWHCTYQGGWEDQMTDEEKARLKALEKFVAAIVDELKANGSKGAAGRIARAVKKVEARPTSARKP